MRPILNNRRIGAFHVNRELIYDNFELAQALMHGLVVVRAEMDLCADKMLYVAIGDHFDEVDPGEAAPFYDLVYLKHDGNLASTFIRKDK